MNRKLVLIMALTLLVAVLTVAFNVQKVKASGTIYIRADGSIDPLTAPISTADNVTYTFTDNINDSIVVERDNIVIDGAGYTVQGTRAYDSRGIDLKGRSNVTIKNMNITAFTYGIYFDSSSNNSVVGNNITANNGWSIMLNGYMGATSNNIVSGNNMTNNGGGIYLHFSSSNNNISGNNIAANKGYGIWLDCSSYNSISGNSIAASTYDTGIYLGVSYNNSVIGNNITANGHDGIWLFCSSNNSISGNNIIKNNWNGIDLESYSNNNSISGNSIAANNWDGIYLPPSSSNNSIYHNNFVNNTQQVDSYSSTNVWDDGYPSGGNYWSDYNGTDANHDGIGDTQYIIDANNTDRYPLMGMFSDFNATSEYQVQTICNSTISAFQFNGTAIIFEVAGEGGITGFCRICIPTALMNSPYDVLVDGIEVPFTLLSCSNATQSYLYFAYAHSTHEIIIRTHIVPPPPLLVSISPVSALTYFGQSVTFTSTASGGTPPYGYQWYMNDSPVSGATSNSWTFALQPIGNYSVYINVTDSLGSIAKSNEASVTVVPQLAVSISPMSASMLVGQSIQFTSTASGGYLPYSYQWYLNGNPVSGVVATIWTFTPTTSGIYYIHLKVTDAKANTAQSETARITVATVPVGGYSFPIQVQTKAEPVLPYIALIAALTAIFTKLRPKTKRKH